MRKNNARSLNIPSASSIRNMIKEEVKAQLEAREGERRGPRNDFWDGPQNGEFMDGPMKEFKDAPMNENDAWNEWWDGPRPSEQEERGTRSRSMNKGPEKGKRSMWNFWDGDYMSDPVMERPRRAREEEEIEASISPVDKPKARRPKARGKRN